MKLSKVEELLVNNPLRAFLQRHVEAPLLLGPAGCLHGKTVLEIGCGRGVMTESLIERYSAERVIAFDIDPEQIDRARMRLQTRYGARVGLFVGDAERIALKDSSVDAVVEIAALHHVLQWTKCVREVVRVLRDGGRFFFEEPLGTMVDNPLVRLLLRHRDEHSFTRDVFRQELVHAGLILSRESRDPLGLMLIGRATKSLRQQ